MNDEKDHGGADAGVDWKKKFKGKTSGGAWIHTHPSVERAIVENHHGFTFDGVAYNSLDEAKTAALSHQPAPVAANASAEARLRDALEQIAKLKADLQAWEITAKRIEEAETEKAYDPTTQPFDEPFRYVDHPHASDCDKQDK